MIGQGHLKHTASNSPDVSSCNNEDTLIVAIKKLNF